MTIAELFAAPFHQWLSDAALFASTDTTVPPVNVVHIESDGTTLLAVATDRYTIGVSRYLPVTNDGPGDAPFAFNLALNDVATVLRTAKTAKKDTGWRQIYMDSTLAKMDENPVVTFKFNSGETLEVKPVKAVFPSWRQLIPQSGTEHARAASEYNPHQLVKFAKVGDRFATVHLSTFASEHSTNSPTAVRIGDTFFGLIMPSNRNGETVAAYTRPDWLGVA